MFWIKKLVTQLFMPISLSLILLLVAMIILRRRKLVKSLIFTSFSLLLFVSSQWGANLLVNPLEEQYPVNNQPAPAECVVMVLGSAHDDSIQGAATQQLSATALSRLTEGLRQLELGQGCQLVVSGWGGGLNHSAHAMVMAQAAMGLGVPEHKIIVLPLAKDTIEEAQHLKWEIGNLPFRLVTSATHMPRSMAIFKQAGLRPQAAPTDFIGRNDYWWKLDARNLLSSQRAIHEYVGKLWFDIRYGDEIELRDAVSESL